jgi:Rhs element Vgr protein
MSPVSPVAEAGLLTFEIKAGGAVIDDTYQIVSIDTWNSVNRVPRARLVIYDGSAADGTFDASSAATFLPGTQIEISGGYDGKLTSIFSGIVTRHGIEIPRADASRLVVDLADAAIKMTVARSSALTEQQKDSDLFSTLIAKYGLTAEVEATTVQYEAFVQFDATDWDTLLARAEMNGMLVIVDAGKVSVKKPDTSSSPALEVKYGESILDLRAEMDSVGQYAASAVKSAAWDSSTQQVIESAAASAEVAEPGNVSSATLANVLNIASFPRVTAGFVVQDELSAWSSAELMRSRLAKICGQVRFHGSALAKTGSMLALSGLGDRFNGNVFIGGVRHRIKDGAWTTTVDFGLPSGWHAQQRPAAFAPASGLLPPIRGLQTGVVKKIDEDKAGAFRILVTLPLVRANGNDVWARLATFYASDAAGTTFYPEIGDEVVVGFMNEDPRFPVVLGSVYSAKLAPPYPPEKTNKIKGLKTKSKLELTFDDTDKIVTIKTPGGHVVVMDDKEGSIKITDSNNNSLTLGKNGIALDSASDITVKAKGNISITPTGNLELKATANATCEGVQIDLKAQAALSAQGNGTAELKSSGIVTVQGSLVKIN